MCAVHVCACECGCFPETGNTCGCELLNVDAGNQTWVIREINKCSETLNGLFSTQGQDVILSNFHNKILTPSKNNISKYTKTYLPINLL